MGGAAAPLALVWYLRYFVMCARACAARHKCSESVAIYVAVETGGGCVRIHGFDVSLFSPGMPNERCFSMQLSF